MLGRHRGPRVAATNDAVTITAIAGKRGGGQDGDLLAWRSMDHGKTWGAPAVLNDVADAAREGLHGLLLDRVICCSLSGWIFARWILGGRHKTLRNGVERWWKELGKERARLRFSRRHHLSMLPPVRHH